MHNGFEQSSGPAGFASLTPRERVVLAGLVGGLRPAEIARRDFVSVVTVRNQVQSILIKLNVHSQLEAVAVARWSGWTDPAVEAPPAAAAI
jgi:DNA-binding NarL/FixJ family response regulator